MSSVHAFQRLGAILIGLFFTVSSHAYTVTGSAGVASTTPGAVTFETFDGPTIPIASITFSGPVGLNAGADPGGGGNWLGISASTGDPGSATITFTGLTSYFGLRWGTPFFTENSLQFFQAGLPIGGPFTGGPPGSGTSDPINRFTNFTASNSAELFDSVVLTATSCCFEVDNLAASLPIAAIPEPSTYALMLAGLGFVGFVASRRRKSQSSTAA